MGAGKTNVKNQSEGSSDSSGNNGEDSDEADNLKSADSFQERLSFESTSQNKDIPYHSVTSKWVCNPFMSINCAFCTYQIKQGNSK